MEEIRKLTGYVGAEILGLDLARGLDPGTGETLRAALAQHGVLVLRDQHLDRAQQKEVTRAFGPVTRLPYVAGLEDDPEVIAVLKEAHEGNSGVFGGAWHSDFSFLEVPPAGSVLNAVEIPPHGDMSVGRARPNEAQGQLVHVLRHGEIDRAGHLAAEPVLGHFRVRGDLRCAGRER